MPPVIYKIAFAAVIVGLFVLDRDRKARTSKALWIPVIWVALAASREVSQWLPLGAPSESIDRTFLAGLIVGSLVVLLHRRREVQTVLRANGPILVYFSYCAISIFWSDAPDHAFQRWIKFLGEFMITLIVLTDPDRSAGLKQFLARIGFLLVPMSILYIRYYPAVGRDSNRSGEKMYNLGVTTNKNTLGLLCLIVGLGCMWRLLEEFRRENGTRKTGPLIAQGTLFVMVLWLLWKANSMTSLAAFLLAGGVMAATSVRALARERAAVHLVILSMLFFAYALLFLDLGPELLGAVGKDPTLTGRTELWGFISDLVQDPLFGSGFESFWLGERLAYLAKIYWWRPNEAHNGYFEVYLNLGWIGVTLLAVVIVTGYRNVIVGLYRDTDAAGLRAAFFVATLVYGLTEAAFRVMSPMWFVFVLAIVGSAADITAPKTTNQKFAFVQTGDQEPLHQIEGNPRGG